MNFTVDEPVSQVAYSLDGQTNMTVVGNTALANLTYGKHNVTVYAWDAAGNIGASKTIDFTVAEPFPSTLVFVTSVGIAVAVIGLVVYFKKRK